jgi:hypothetical protein
VEQGCRPVAMVPLLAKPYTIILNNMLVAWAEAAGVRVPAQTGFRPRHATVRTMRSCCST